MVVITYIGEVAVCCMYVCMYYYMYSYVRMMMTAPWLLAGDSILLYYVKVQLTTARSPHLN
eukprot:COSAG06_NODE_33707_length_485_cov_1.183938_1_plen_60_part_01